jgi:hypothetical protein
MRSSTIGVLRNLANATATGDLIAHADDDDIFHPAGQRRVNLIWKYTQAFIAICVVVSTMIAGVVSAMAGKGEQVPTILSVAFVQWLASISVGRITPLSEELDESLPTGPTKEDKKPRKT